MPSTARRRARGILGRVTTWLRALWLSAALVGCASAHAQAPASCPHAEPADGSVCEPPGFEACTYTTEGVTRICSCDRETHRWRCSTLPAAPPS